ncbi:Signal transduction histidine kinase [Anoxybacillus flavithermus]|nr:Signal transduction histidine kinase [Anoxybacillus flavithermus]
MKKGLEQGREEGKNETIRKMVEKGMSITDVAHILDMTEEEVRERLGD